MTVKDIDFNKDYYKILGVDKGAGTADIKKAFRNMSLKYHPDKHADDSEEEKKAAEDKFKEVNEAWSVLQDKNLRTAYDAGPQQLFFGGFGNGFGFNRPRGPEPGTDVIVRVRVSYEDICNGIDKTIKYKKKVRCEHCHGVGGEGIEECQHCGGTGVIVKREQRMGMLMMQQTTCPYCHGKGKSVKHTCEHCHGTGLTETDTTYDIKLDTENLIQDHIRLFVGYYGNESVDENGMNGRLIIEITHDIDNMQIVMTDAGCSVVEVKEIPYYDMILGTKVEINTPDGKTLSVVVPECCVNGQQLRIRGKGFMIDGYGTGDYIVIINAKATDDVTAEEKKLLEQIKELHS